MIVHIKNTKNSTKKLLEIENEFRKITGHKISIPNMLHFYTSIMKEQKEKLINPIYNFTKYNRIHRNRDACGREQSRMTLNSPHSMFTARYCIQMNKLQSDHKAGRKKNPQ